MQSLHEMRQFTSIIRSLHESGVKELETRLRDILTNKIGSLAEVEDITVIDENDSIRLNGILNGSISFIYTYANGVVEGPQFIAKSENSNILDLDGDVAEVIPIMSEFSDEMKAIIQKFKTNLKS